MQRTARTSLHSSFSLALMGVFVSACSAAEPGDVSLQDSVSLQASKDQAAVPHLHEAPGCADHGDEEEAPEARVDAAKKVSWKSGKTCKGEVEQIKILGFNDFHGQLSAGRLVAGRPVGGAAVMASYLKAAAATVDGRALIVHAGDHVGASPPASALLQDEPAISFMNLLTNKHCKGAKKDSAKCNVVGTLGNHEFDEGTGEMLRLVYGGSHENGPFLEDDYDGARFSYVSSNVVDAESGKSILPAYVVRQVGQVKVGLIGAVLKETPTIVTPSGVAGLTFLDEATSINKAVKALKKKKVEAIGVAIHQGGTQTSYTGETVPGGSVSGAIVAIVAQLDPEVDFVVSGHAHGFTNALLPNSAGELVLVTQAFSSSTAYGELELGIEVSSGEVVEKSAVIVTTFADQAPGNAPDPEVAELVTAAEQLTAPLVNQVVGQAEIDLTRAENPAGESSLGNLIADAQRSATGADIAFMNPGGIRADLFAGEVTWGELFTIQPFGNSLVTMDLTGQEVIDVLNQQWVGQAFPRIMKPSGISYVWDPAIPVGTNRIVSAMVAGQPLDLLATYRVTVNSFMASGGDGFTVFNAGTNRVGGDVDLDALIVYVSALTQPFSSVIEGRISNP